MTTIPIVIVSCMRDIVQLKILLQSLEKFVVESADVHIISGDLDSETFFKNVNDYIKFGNNKHTCHLHTARDVLSITSSNGWVHQELLKLCAYKLFTTDYLALDSKTVFIQPWSFSDLKINGKYITSGLPLSHLHLCEFKDAVTYYMNFFEISPDQIECVEHCATPFVMEHRVLQSLATYFDSEIEFVRWFADVTFDSGDFTLHSIFSQKLTKFNRHITTTKSYFRVWNGIDVSPASLAHAFESKQYKIVSIHRRALNNPSFLMEFNKQIAKLGLN